MTIYYFAYGSNMSSPRLQARTPSATFHCTAVLPQHQLKFHKVSEDGSAKCDVVTSTSAEHQVHGVVYCLNEAEKPLLDAVEGLGNGYREHHITVFDQHHRGIDTCLYMATHTDPQLLPYRWYHHHVISGARQHALPEHYRQLIEQVNYIEDPDVTRHQAEMAIYR